ncbi:glycosyltransferase [Erythrobacter sp. F6033]|uniref:glycosyltransferase n=1 Tax=Erythrobacter sp. F6033 TaxID=2926401 RepID=UPI001FF6E080|nr:glycosyltransferase [Erythrobacter sp. F6033]MCK0129807.1 glycosyltransferase [Erythrobacter sp. F6033]
MRKEEPLSLGIVTGSMSRNAGGLFNSVRKSALNLAEIGADVSVYALEDEHSAADYAEWAPLQPKVLPVRLGGLFPYAPALPQRLDHAKHDVLHLHGIWQLNSRAVNNWKRQTGRPVMISPRGMLDPWALSNSAWKKKLVGAWFENRNLGEADCMHALNASEAASMRAFGLTGPIATIPNATDLPEIGERMPRSGKKTLLFLGRVHPKKGLSELIDAWAAACKMRPELTDEWSLAIAGWDDGGHLAPLRQSIAEQGVADSISILGPAFGNEKDKLLRDADAFVLPSYSEGLPMSVLEAWAYRLPVLMTDACNLPEGFAENAALQITTDPEELSQSLVSGLLDRDISVLGENGRRLVQDRFSWRHVAQEHLAVYDWLLDRGPLPACVQMQGA